MRILYRHPGPVVRVVGPLVWSPENGYVLEVGNADVIADLLTAPGAEFVVDPADPILRLPGMSTDLIISLASEGVTGVEDIKKFAEEENAASCVGVEEDLLAQWVAITSEKE